MTSNPQFYRSASDLPFPLAGSNLSNFRVSQELPSFAFTRPLHVPSSFDPCFRLCSSYSASRLGNGYDLCDDPQLSSCVDTTRLCRNLYWSTDDAGQDGLVYEIDPQQATDLVPVSCEDATEVVQQPGRWQARNHTLDSIIQSAVLISTHFLAPPHFHYTSSSPIVRQSRYDDLPPMESLMTSFRDSLGFVEQRSSLATPPSYQFALPSITNIRTSIQSRTSCDVMALLRLFQSQSLTDEFVSLNLSRPNGSSTTLFLQRLLDALPPADRSVVQDQGTLAINFDSPSSIWFPAGVNISYRNYRLIGLVHRLDNGRFSLSIARNGSWYRTSGRTMSRTSRPQILTNFTDVVTAFYSRIV